MTRLAAYVDEKIRAAADSTPTGDSLRLAVLAALNIADELFRCRDATSTRDGLLAERAGELERLVDRVLMASVTCASLTEPSATKIPSERLGSLLCA